jgi:diguanylate cyclase (GGDEF)-like protein
MIGRPMVKLVVTNGPEKRVLPLDATPVTIGRDPENTLTIEGADVSRRHCRIEPDGTGSWRVVDLGSKNGTLLNGRPITGPSPLRASDKLTIGDASVVILPEEAESTPAAAPPVPIGSLQPRGSSRERAVSSLWPSVNESDPFGFTEGEDDDGSSSTSIDKPAPGQDRRTTRGFLKDRLLRLNLLSQAIASELDLDRLLDAILDAVIDFTGFERGLLLLVEDGGELKPVLGRNLDHQQLQPEERNFSSNVIELALKRRDATLVRDVPDDRRSAGWDPKASWASLGLKSALCLPLMAPLRGRPAVPVQKPAAPGERRRVRVPTRLFGMIYLDSQKEVRPFDAKDRRLLRTVGAQAAIAIQNAKLHQQATTDPLTQLANRGFFEQHFAEEIKNAIEHGTAMAILMLDIDRFKSVNDRYGHQVGDQVLRELAKRVRDSIRRDDLAGRYGGEEFIILLPGAGLDAAKTVAYKIRTALKASPMSAEQIPVTASIGIAIFPDHGRDAASLTKRADQALYLAKHSGRDRAEVWRASLDRSGHRMDALAGMVSGDAARDQRNLKVLLEMGALALAPLEAKDYLARVLDKVIELTRAERALLFLGDDPDHLDLAAKRVRMGVVSAPEEAVKFSGSSVRSAVLERRALCLLDAADGDWQKSGPSSSIESLRLKTVMCVPLATPGARGGAEPSAPGDGLLGALYVDDKAVRREFAQGDLVALEALGNQLSLALAYDPRFIKERKADEEVTTMRIELARLREENAKLRESKRSTGPRSLADTAADEETDVPRPRPKT